MAYFHQAGRVLRLCCLLALCWCATAAYADRGLPFTEQENADGARFVWYVLGRSDMKFDYLPADHFPESPDFTPVEHGLQRSGDVAWWPHLMAIYDATFAQARELPADVAIITAQGPRSLTVLEQEMGPATFYRYRAGGR